MDLSSIHNFQDSVVTVMGLGRYKQGSGMGAAKWLVRHGAQTVITDLKSAPELHESVTLLMDWYRRYRDLYPDRTLYQPVFVLGEHRKDDFVGVDCVVQNPGVPSESEFIVTAKEAKVPIESDVSLFFRFYQHPIVAVTGTKGKTTTTLLLGEMMKRKDPKAVTAGNIKVSPLEHLDALIEEPSPIPVVLELSSWMLESLPQAFTDLGHGPDIAILTNVYPDHLDRYASFDAYIASKRIIFEHQTASQFTLLNWDHDLVRTMEPLVKGKLFWFSKTAQDHDGCYVKDGNIVFRRNSSDMVITPMSDVALKGEHNIENILSATCAAMLADIPLPEIVDVLKHFEGVTDRQEIVREVDEITYVNDTAATGPDAVIAALRRFHGDQQKMDIILIAGGVNKNLAYDGVAQEVVKTCKAVFLLPGDASDMLEKAIGKQVPVTKVGSMQEAVQGARKVAEHGDTVLLSPGATSFNLFRNEFERGEQFREEVRNL